MRMLVAVLLALVAIPAAAQTPLPADAPLLLPQMPLHDPFIVADEATKTYWLFTSNNASMTGVRALGTMAYSSKDLKHWTRPKLVFTAPQGTWIAGGAWAPEVHHWKGKWYLFTTFHNEALTLPSVAGRKNYRRGTTIAIADRPDGPYTAVRGGEPVVAKEQMTLDGTPYVDPAGKPWMVYAHEWLQMTNGTMEAVPLNDDLSAAGPSKLLFAANAVSWGKGQVQPEGDPGFVTDGPQLYRSKTGALLMLWSTYDANGYVETQARSKSGTIEGPWEQMDPLVKRESGHGMLFRTFDGKLMMIVHRPFNRALGKLYEMRDDGDRLSVVREAVELDLEAYPTHPCTGARC